jgi:hypothetical protein
MLQVEVKGRRGKSVNFSSRTRRRSLETLQPQDSATTGGQLHHMSVHFAIDIDPSRPRQIRDAELPDSHCPLYPERTFH